MYNSRDYDRFNYLKKKLFIITNLEAGRFHNKISKYEDRATTIFSVVFGIIILISAFTFHTICELTGLGAISVFIILFILGCIISFMIILKVQYNMNERVRERTISGEGNIKFDLSNVWKITPGGIQENIKLINDNTVSIRYTSQAVIVRGTMKGVIDCESTADKQHYDTLQRLVDIAMRENYELDIINLPYNIDNDPLWDSESEKIYRTSHELGSNYTMLMTSLHNHIYEFTKNNSRVTVVYYIFKSNPISSITPQTLAIEIQKLNQYFQMKITGINTKEFKILLEEYYGIAVSIEDITNFMTVTSIDLGECKIISYKDIKGNLIHKNKSFNYTLPDIFTTLDTIEGHINETFNDVSENMDDETNEPTYDTIFDKDII